MSSRLLASLAKKFCLGIVGLLTFISIPATSSAGGPLDTLFYGQNHTYSITLRGNGEAVVYARFVVTNPDETPQSSFSFDLAGASANDLIIYQQILPKICVRYDYQEGRSSECAEYRDPDPRTDYYYPGQGITAPEYKKVTYTLTGSEVKFSIPTPIESNKSTIFLLAYTSKSYITNSAGLLKFDFISLKVSTRIEQLAININTDSDLYLRGGLSNLNYASSVPPVASGAVDKAASNAALDSLSYRLTTSNGNAQITKYAKDLAPNDTYHVKGSYAKSWLRLYLANILIGLLIIAAIVIGLVLLAKRLQKNEKKEPKEQNAVILYTVYSLISSLAIIAITLLLPRLTSYPVYFPSLFYSPSLSMLIFIGIFMLYAFILVGPAVLLASKLGWKAALYTLLADFGWLVLFIILYITLFQTGAMQPSIPYSGGMM